MKEVSAVTCPRRPQRRRPPSTSLAYMREESACVGPSFAHLLVPALISSSSRRRRTLFFFPRPYACYSLLCVLGTSLPR